MKGAVNFMNTQDILNAVYNWITFEEIWSKDSRGLSSRAIQDQDYKCKSAAYFGVREYLIHLAGQNWEYDDEDGMELYTGLIQYTSVFKVVEFNPTRMIKRPDLGTEFASDLMTLLGKSEQRLIDAYNKYKLENGDWIKKSPDPNEPKKISPDEMNMSLYAVSDLTKDDEKYWDMKKCKKIHELAKYAHGIFQQFRKDHNL